MSPPARTITVALDMSKGFDTINIHTLIRKLLQTNIPGTIIKFIANYVKGRKAYTTYRNHTSRQRQFETGVPQDGVLSPTLFNIYTSDLPTPSTPVQFMAYADDITITSTHPSTSVAMKYIQPYLQKVFAWTKQNNLILNPVKTTCTLYTPNPVEYTSNQTYNTIMKPALEYNASSIWSPLASSTSINKLQVMQNAALRTATECTHDTNIQHLHDETLTLPIHEYLQLHASEYKQKPQHPSSPLHKHTTYFDTQRLKIHYFQQRPLHNKHSHRPPHSHYNRHKNKHGPHTYIYCLYVSSHKR